MTSRTLLGAFIGVGVVVFSLWAVLLPQSSQVRLAIPLGGSEGFPLPIWYWLGIGLYAWAFGWFVGVPVHARWVWAIRLGVSLHLLLLLADLTTYLVAPAQQVFASRWYAWYSQAVWGLVLAGGVIVAGRRLRSWNVTRLADPSLFFLPLLLGYGVLWIISLPANPSWVLGTTAGGIIWLVVMRQLAQAPQAIERWRQAVRAWRSDERVFLLIIFTIALGIRLFYTARVMTNPDFLNTGSDGPFYDQLAWDLVQGKGMSESLRQTYAFLVPGYIRFVALVYWLGGRNYFLVCAVQSVLGAATCLLTYAMAKRLFGPTTAKIAAAFAAIDFPLVFAAAAMGHQGMDLFLSSLVVWLLIRYVETPKSWGTILGIGLLLGWATVTREGNAVFWLFLVGWFLLVARRRLGRTTAVHHAAWLTVGFLLVVLPFIYVEVVKPGHVGSFHQRLTRLFFINAPYKDELGINPFADPGGAWTQLLKEPSAVLVPVAKNAAGNFATVFLSQGYGRFDPVFLIRGSLYYYGMWCYAYVFALIGFGLVILRIARRSPQALGLWLIVGFLASRTSVHLFLEAAYRYRPPLEPFLIMCAAYGLTQVLRIGTRDALAVG